MRRAFLSCLTAIWLVGSALLAGQNIPLHDLSRLRLWLVAVDRHQPGAADDAAKVMGSWSDDDLDRLFIDVNALVHLVRSARSGRVPLPSGVRPFTPSEMSDLASLADAERLRMDNRLVKRGALLHTDIASLGLARGSLSLGRVAGRQLLVPRSVSILVHDGLGAGMRDASVHWEFARLLLDQVIPEPGRDLTVVAWYRASALFFAAHHMYADAMPHLERALRLFPTDAALLVDSGCIYEALGAPAIQNFAATAILPTGVTLAVRSGDANWRQAERLFRRAVELDEGLAEAHLRLGRVIGLQGRHAEAVVELEKAAAASDEKRLQYFAQLVLGAEYHAVNHVDRARQAFDQAAALYPRAQSPRLGASQLARQIGDRTGALRALQPVLEAGTSESQRYDPWWTYYDGPGGDVDRAIAEMRAALYLADRP